MPLIIETHPSHTQLSDSELECIEIDGCTLPELAAVLRLQTWPERKSAINELCKTHPWKRTGKGGQAPGCGIGYIVNNPERKDQKVPTDSIALQPVNREQTLLALKGRAGSLNVSQDNWELAVSNTFRTGKLERYLSNARPDDRLATISRFHTGAKNEADVISMWFILVEIDDDSLFDAAKDFGPSVLPGLALEHIQTARLALGAFLREDGQAIAPPPFYICYSGRRSFHMLWQLGHPATPADIQTLKNGKSLLLRRLKELSPERQAALPDSLKALASIDTQAVFNPIVMVRLPCQVQEEGRFPQMAWTTKEQGILSLGDLLATANARITRYGHLETMAAMQRRIWAFTAAPKPSQKIDDTDIDAAFPGDAKKPRHGDGFSVRCPFHSDRTHSAFVSDSGFIFCSVCCTEGQPFIGRVRKGGAVERTG